MWWIKNSPAPVPLVTTGGAVNAGTLGSPDTVVVLGGSPIEYDLQHGARFRAGLWLDDRAELGIEASYLFLAGRSVSESASVAVGGVLSNPFFDASTNAESANLLGSGTAGAAALTNRSRIQGAELNALSSLRASDSANVGLLAGFRFLQLREGLTLTTVQTDPNVIFFPGQFVSTVDDFSTRNNFYGGQLGARLDLARGAFFLQTAAKLALGYLHETVAIQGVTTTNTGAPFPPGVPIPVTTVPGGIYAQPTNIGVHHRDRFAAVPEITIQAGLTVRERMRVFVGYSFLYLSEVVRASNQIDRTINSTQLLSFTGVPTGPLVGAARPAPLFNGSDFWAQGISFGLQFGW